MKNQTRFVLLTILAVLLVSIRVQAKLIDPASYAYPYQDPYLATLTLDIMYAKKKAVEIQVPPLPGRDNVAFFEGRGSVSANVYAQKEPAPLVYVITGVGGFADDGGAMWIAENLYREGFSAMIIPSPMCWRFVLGQSRLAVPGFSPEDASDLRRFMNTAEKKAESITGLRPTRKAVVGYSLGAIDAAFVMKAERAKPLLGIERAIMINPPLRIEYALAQLDRMNALGDGLTSDQKAALEYQTEMTGLKIIRRDIDDPSYFQNLDRMFQMRGSAVPFLIGMSIRKSLADTIFVSQQIRDIGLLHVPLNRSLPEPRENEAASISYVDYLMRGAYPFWQRQLGTSHSLLEIESQADLNSLRDLFARDSAYVLFHNQDDFLTDPNDLHQMEQAMGDRATIYPYGGHVGNLWFQMNQRDLQNSLKDLL